MDLTRTEPTAPPPPVAATVGAGRARAGRRGALALAAIALLALGACSGSLGTNPTATTKPPLPVKDLCKLGADVFVQIDHFDRTAPDFLDKIKNEVRPLADRAPADVREDMQAWVNFILSATDATQLASFPSDLKVSTRRIDEWWKRNCGTTLIGA